MADTKRMKAGFEMPVHDVPPTADSAPPALLDGAISSLGRGTIQRKIARRLAQRNAAREGTDPALSATPAAEAMQRASQGAGSPIPGPIRSQVEAHTGADLSGARVHTGEASAQAAAAIEARAYTMGQDIHFGQGQFQPGSREGDHLLAHELVHTVQQGAGAPSPQTKLEFSAPGDASEIEADSIADAVIGGGAQGLPQRDAIQSRSPVVARAPAKEKEAPTGAALGRSLEARIDAVATNALATEDAVADAITGSVGQLDGTLEALNRGCDVYTDAYEQVKRAVDRAEGELAAEDAFRAALVSIFASALVGLALEAVPFAVAASARSASVVTQLAGGIGSWGVATAIGSLTPESEAVGQEFLEKANPLLKRLDIYKTAQKSMREVALLATALRPITTVARGCAASKADARELAVSGKLGGNGVAELQHKVGLLESMGTRVTDVKDKTQAVLDRATEAKAAAERAFTRIDRESMVRQIFIRWMAGLKGSDRRILETRAMGDALEVVHLKGPHIDDKRGESKIGWYSSFDDEGDEAADKARQALLLLNLVGKVGTAHVQPDEYGNRRSTMGHVTFPEMPFDPMRPGGRLGMVLDTEVQDGGQVEITGVFGRSKEDDPFILYGRPVGAKSAEKELDQREHERRQQLI